MPRQPTTTAPDREDESGTVIVAGDSWTCSQVSFGPRYSPKNVILMRRNM